MYFEKLNLTRLPVKLFKYNVNIIVLDTQVIWYLYIRNTVLQFNLNYLS